MTYAVLISPTFRDELREQVVWLQGKGAPEDVVVRWVHGLYDALDRLHDAPERCPRDDARSRALGIEVRRLSHGDHLVLYHVDHDRREVSVLHLRHGARGDDGPPTP